VDLLSGPVGVLETATGSEPSDEVEQRLLDMGYEMKRARVRRNGMNGKSQLHFGSSEIAYVSLYS
jgi:hypothetical protein